MNPFRGVLFLTLCIASIKAVPDISNLFEYNEGDRYFVTTDSKGKLRLVDLELSDLNSKFNAETDVFFHLYTRSNPQELQMITYGDIESLSSSNYNHSNPTKLTTHGWGSSARDGTCLMIRDRTLAIVDANIICVDWEIGADALYPTSAANVPKVGQRVGQFIDWLVEEGSSSSGFHMIGHSLGGHVAGIAGRSVAKGRLPYVTALDPAMPLWGVASERIRPSDGLYVEAIHTNARNLGLWAPVGHADFYPNGGKQQPGCSAVDVGCSHGRSVALFGYSLDAEPRFEAARCASIDEIDEGACTSVGRAYMGGAWPKGVFGVYYLTTSANPPYYNEDPL